jgi:hypothetical protein
MSTSQAAAANRIDARTTHPSLRDRSMAYSVRPLFGNRFEVEGNGRRYYVECVFIGGDFIARCSCPDKKFNHAPTCKHEEAVCRHERHRVAEAQGFYQ